MKQLGEGAEAISVGNVGAPTLPIGNGRYVSSFRVKRGIVGKGDFRRTRDTKRKT